jgi:hypothetical protein
MFGTPFASIAQGLEIVSHTISTSTDCSTSS